MNIINNNVSTISNSSSNSCNAIGENSFDFKTELFNSLYNQLVEDAPESVNDALSKTQEETGLSAFGIGEDGSITHLTPLLVEMMNKQYLTGSSNIFGNSVSSAISSVENIISSYKASQTYNYGENYNDNLMFLETFLSNLVCTVGTEDTEHSQDGISPIELYNCGKMINMF